MGNIANAANERSLVASSANQMMPTQAASLSEQMQWAQAVRSAGILPDAYKNHPADVLVAVGFGQSMGLSPAESLYRINVIKGKPTMSAELIAAQVRKAGHKLRIRKDAANMSVTVTIIRCDDPEYPFEMTRDAAWAKQMGLDQKDNYKKQPLTMLTWRAITACAREACPEALYGVAYTPDEMHDLDNPPAIATPTSKRETDTQPDQVDAQIIADREQVVRVTELLKHAGVDSIEKAKTAFMALCGRELETAAQLTHEEAETLLEYPEQVSRKVAETLTATETNEQEQ